MKQFINTIARWLLIFADPRKLLTWPYLLRYIKHWWKYQAKSGNKLGVADSYPCLTDWVSATPFDPHYFYQGAWLARRVNTSKVVKHVDIGSSVLTMSVLSAQVETLFVDYRPLKASLSGLTSIAGNILDLPFSDASINSLSCLHVIEHIGLGRYGDPIDPLGSKKAALELQRVVSSSGNLFLSLPIGRERICFNAHRVHSPLTVLKLFPEMELIEFCYVDDVGEYHENQLVDVATNLEYGCGMFHFKKC